MAKGLCVSVLGMLVMACSGCGGGGGGSSPVPVTLAAPAPIKTVLVDAEGDSTMCGFRITNGVGTCLYNVSPPTVMQGLLQKQFGPTVTVENNGVPGTTITQNLNGSLYNGVSTAPLATRLSSDSAQIVIENFGINDYAKSTLDIFRRDLNTWITTVQAMGKIPVLEEPNPLGYPNNLSVFVAVIDEVAQERNVALIQQYAYIMTLPNWQGMLTDGVHPGDQLYAIKAQREYNVIAPIVASLQK